jgi:hypothetical protein
MILTYLRIYGHTQTRARFDVQQHLFSIKPQAILRLRTLL